MAKYELVRQKYTDPVNKSWAVEFANAVEEEALGEYPTVGMAATFRAFLIKEKKYSSEPTGLLASTAYYIREKAEDTPTPDPAKKARHSAVLSFQGNQFELSVTDAMRLKALMESFIPGAVVLVSPNEAGTEEA